LHLMKWHCNEISMTIGIQLTIYVEDRIKIEE
jgi:hypothetical protein